MSSECSAILFDGEFHRVFYNKHAGSDLPIILLDGPNRIIDRVRQWRSIELEDTIRVPFVSSLLMDTSRKRILYFSSSDILESAFRQFLLLILLRQKFSDWEIARTSSGFTDFLYLLKRPDLISTNISNIPPLSRFHFRNEPQGAQCLISVTENSHEYKHFYSRADIERELMNGEHILDFLSKESDYPPLHDSYTFNGAIINVPKRNITMWGTEINLADLTLCRTIWKGWSFFVSPIEYYQHLGLTGFPLQEIDLQFSNYESSMKFLEESKTDFHSLSIFNECLERLRASNFV